MTSSNKARKIVERAQQVLSQDRGVLNFENYQPSQQHLHRMQYLAESVPELYNNSTITPRSTWFSHPRYHQNSQMPPFHVHFRQEMQGVIHYLVKAYNGDPSKPPTDNIRRSHSTFVGSMRGLSGHVSIEEYACFPLYKETFPNVDLKCLYQEHNHLHELETAVKNSLADLLENPTKDVVSTLEVVLDYDDKLMAHLGEEEEIVVPMSLTEKQIWF